MDIQNKISTTCETMKEILIADILDLLIKYVGT
jgi:hypothetical protein